MYQHFLKSVGQATLRLVVQMPISPFNISTTVSVIATNPELPLDSGRAQHVLSHGDITEQGAIDAYQDGIENLLDALDETDTTSIQALKSFQASLADEPSDVSSTGRREFLEPEVVQKFQKFCALVQENKLPKETIQKAIANLSKGIGASAPDTAAGITAAAEHLHALARGIPDNFKKHLIENIKFVALEYLDHVLRINAGSSGRSDHLNALFNSVAHEYDLESYPVLENYGDLDAFKSYFKQSFKIESVMQEMATECLLRVHEFFGPTSWRFLNSEDVKEFQYRLKNELQPELEFSFGTLEAEDIIQRCAAQKDVCILVNHNALLLPIIARNVKAAGIYPLMWQNLGDFPRSQAATSVKTEVEELVSALHYDDKRTIAELIGKIGKEHLKIRDEAGHTLAMAALLSDHVPECRHIISRMDVEDIKMKNNSGKNLFWMAVDILNNPLRPPAFRGHMLDIVKYLVNYQDNVRLEVKNIVVE